MRVVKYRYIKDGLNGALFFNFLITCLKFDDLVEFSLESRLFGELGANSVVTGSCKTESYQFSFDSTRTLEKLFSFAHWRSYSSIIPHFGTIFGSSDSDSQKIGRPNCPN